MIFDLIAGTGTDTGGIGSWTPAELFKSGEEGAWYDASDWSSMSQDASTHIPVTAIGQYLAVWLNKIDGQPIQYDIGQPSASPRPTIASNNGKLVVRFDGVDDQVDGNLVNKNYTAITMAVGQKKSAHQTANMFDVHAGVAEIRNQSNGTVLGVILEKVVNSVATLSLSAPNVIVAYGSPTVAATLRVNGVAATGAVTAAPAWNIRVNIPGTPGNACDISQVVFINRTLTAGELTLLESYIASKQ